MHTFKKCHVRISKVKTLSSMSTVTATKTSLKTMKLHFYHISPQGAVMSLSTSVCWKIFFLCCCSHEGLNILDTNFIYRVCLYTYFGGRGGWSITAHRDSAAFPLSSHISALLRTSCILVLVSWDVFVEFTSRHLLHNKFILVATVLIWEF